MSQENELAAAKRKIRALSEKTIENGCSENEVYAAMTKIGEMLDRFNLEMSEVTLRQEPCVTEYFDTGSKHRGVVFSASRGISNFCQVKHWQHRTKTKGVGIRLAYFGLESDVQMAMFLSGMISVASKNAIESFKMMADYKRSAYKRAQTFSFYNGMAGRLYERLTTMTTERAEAEAKAAAYHREQMKDHMVGMSPEAAVAFSRQTTGTALISVSKAKFVEEEMKRKGPKLRSKTNKTRAFSSAGYGAGSSAADKVNLSRPLAHRGYGSTLMLQ